MVVGSGSLRSGHGEAQAAAAGRRWPSLLALWAVTLMAGMTPALVGSGRQGAAAGPARSRIARHALPLRRVSGGQEFMQVNPAARRPFGVTAPFGPLELGLAEKTDLPDIVDLLTVSFDRLFAKKRVDAGAWGPLGSLVAPWNAFNRAKDQQDMRKGVDFRLELAMLYPTLRRPVRRDESIGVLARGKRSRGGSDGPLIAYFELCTLPPDGRRPEDEKGPKENGGERCQPAPYFSNLCVAENCRRRGLGRAMLQLAEDIVTNVWGDTRLYLHIDEYEPSQGLYPSHGYVPVSPKAADGVTHMWRELEPFVVEAALEVDQELPQEEEIPEVLVPVADVEDDEEEVEEIRLLMQDDGPDEMDLYGDQDEYVDTSQFK
mmetsp:Transcript_59325/g.130283  ORF Transcript_59325/g.130283 Transcript_59325/m.130283 type:complete len:375 (-) Transcript_59325:170-1294(-)